MRASLFDKIPGSMVIIVGEEMAVVSSGAARAKRDIPHKKIYEVN